MDLSNAQAFAGLRATATPDAPNVRNDNEIGIAPFTQLLTGAQVAFSVRATMASADVLTLDPLTNDASTSVFADVPASIVITGTLTDGTNSVTFPTMLFAGFDANGFPRYTELGLVDPEYEFQIKYDGGAWEITAGGTLNGAWGSTEDEISPTDVVTWTADSPSTGTPTLTGSTAKATGYTGGDGKDIYGATLPAIDTIQGIIVKCTSGAATIEVSTDEKLTVSAGDTRLCFNTAGVASFADDIEATASASNTVLDIIVIGKLSA